MSWHTFKQRHAANRQKTWLPLMASVGCLMSRLLFFILLISLVPFAQAQGDGSQFAVFAGFELGKATLGQIAQNLGPAKPIETGDAGEYEARISYRTPAGLIHYFDVVVSVVGTFSGNKLIEFRVWRVETL